MDKIAIQQLYRSGVPIKRICQIANVCSRSIYVFALPPDEPYRTTRLTDAMRRTIRRAPHESTRKLAKRLGVSKTTISRYRNSIAPTSSIDKVEILKLYRSGVPIKRICKDANVSQSSIYRWVLPPNEPHRVRHLTDSMRKVIDNSPRESSRNLARRLGVSKSTVSRYRNSQWDEEETDEELMGFVHLEKAWLCPHHGPVKIWPCVTCAALKHGNGVHFE